MTDKEKIRAEVYRRFIEAGKHDGVIAETREDELSSILSFIDSMREEPVSEDLLKASMEFAKGFGEWHYAMPCFQAGAKWHKQQMIKSAKLSGWVARDENGSLHLFEVEPSRIMHRWWDRDYHSTTLDNKDFPDLEWENEPVYVKLPIIVED